MAAYVKKEPNSDLYDSEQTRANPYHAINYSQESNARNFDRARWSEQDMEILFGWFQDPHNLASYTNGVKAKAMRAMAEKIPGKTDRQVLNKMTALENHYHQCKSRLKQGIPLTERDLECGIDSAQAKVKSIFRYYYEMDHILGTQPQSAPVDMGYSHQSRHEEQPDYDSPRILAPNGAPHPQQIAHHSLTERISPSVASASNRASFPASGGYTPETYPQETFTHESYNQPKYATHGSSSNLNRRNPNDGNEALPNMSSIRPESHNYQQRDHDNPPPSRREPGDSYLTLAPLNSRHGEPRTNEQESANRGTVGYKGTADISSDRRVRLAEEKLAFKRAKHQESMALAYRQFEAEEEARKVAQRQHQEILDLRLKEYQLRVDELALERARLGIAAKDTPSLPSEPHIVVTPAKECEAGTSITAQVQANTSSLSEAVSKPMEGDHPIQAPNGP